MLFRIINLLRPKVRPIPATVPPFVVEYDEFTSEISLHTTYNGKGFAAELSPVDAHRLSISIAKALADHKVEVNATAEYRIKPQVYMSDEEAAKYDK